MIVAAKVDPTATAKMKSKTFNLLSKKNGECDITDARRED
jgi:hypothetical protein